MKVHEDHILIKAGNDIEVFRIEKDVTVVWIVIRKELLIFYAVSEVLGFEGKEAWKQEAWLEMEVLQQLNVLLFQDMKNALKKVVVPPPQIRICNRDVIVLLVWEEAKKAVLQLKKAVNRLDEKVPLDIIEQATVAVYDHIVER